MISNNQTEQIEKQELENEPEQEKIVITQVSSNNLPNFPILMQTEYA